MAGIHNFKIEQGETWTAQVKWEGQNITGYSARMQLKRRVGGDVALSLTTENGRIDLTSPEIGLISLSLSSTETAALSGEYVYDLELVSGENVAKILKGYVYINPEVTS